MEGTSGCGIGWRRVRSSIAGVAGRKDFGMAWNEVVEAGGVLVGDEVEILLDIEAVPAQP